jgi:hypothetical protein
MANEVKVGETPVEKTDDIATKAAALKKAGFSTVVTIIILLLSTPGFYSLFIDSTSKEAKAKAVESQIATTVAYELLKAKAENMEGQIATLRGDVKELAGFVREMAIQQAAVNSGARPGGRRVTAANAPEPPVMPTIAPVMKSAQLPSNLDPLVQLQVKEELSE